MSHASYQSIALNTRAECHTDDTAVSLTPDQMAVIKKAAADAMQAIHFVAEMVADQRLTVDIRSNGLSVAFSQLERIAEAAGFAADRAADRKATLKVLRAANERIRELESELASKVSGEAMAAAVNKSIDAVSSAWQAAGFRFADEIQVKRRWLEATLHCDADDGMFTFSDSPESDKRTAEEKREALEAAGITFIADGNGRGDVVYRRQ